MVSNVPSNEMPMNQSLKVKLTLVKSISGLTHSLMLISCFCKNGLINVHSNIIFKSTRILFFNSLNIVWKAQSIFLFSIWDLLQIGRVRLFFVVCFSSSIRRATDATKMFLLMAVILKINCLKISTDFVSRVFVA